MLLTIISGGQTGADRAALDIGLAWGLSTTGWVPKGRLAEDGPLPTIYANMKEADSSDVSIRTTMNARDSDATIIFSHGDLTGGSLLTQTECKKFEKACLHIDFLTMNINVAATKCTEFVNNNNVINLNIAGPRESEDNLIYKDTFMALDIVFRNILGDCLAPKYNVEIGTALISEALANFRHWDQIRWITPLWFLTLLSAVASAGSFLSDNKNRLYVSVVFLIITILGRFCVRLQKNLIKYHNETFFTLMAKIGTLYISPHEKNILRSSILPFDFNASQGYKQTATYIMSKTIAASSVISLLLFVYCLYSALR